MANGWAKDVSELKHMQFSHLSVSTVRCALQRHGLWAYVHYKKPYLSKEARKGCYKRANTFLNWMDEDWLHVIFSNESKFKLFSSDGHQWCWRYQEQALDPWFTQKKVKHGGGSFMVWGCIIPKGISWLHCIEGTMDAAVYTQILQKSLLQSLYNHRIKKTSVYFQQDNDPVRKIASFTLLFTCIVFSPFIAYLYKGIGFPSDGFLPLGLPSRF